VLLPKSAEKRAIFAGLLAYMDSKSERFAEAGELRLGSNTPAGQFAQKMTKKTEFMLERGIDEDFVNRVINTIAAALPQLNPSLQHGDFTPWHVLETPAGKSVLIDCEHVSASWPRYYDLANFYSQLSVRFDRDDLAEHLLKDVSEQTGKPIVDSLDFRMMVLMRHFVRAVEYKDDEILFRRAVQKTQGWQARYT
jgi:Ser/Thr protein kinase RdoA (MazF antagonist)